VKFDPSGISTRIQNTSGKTIVGLTFYAALADATEHWKWYHYDFDDSRPLREFGWNKEIKPMASKSLSWGADLDFEHGGGGAFVLTSALFSDGTSWEETSSGSSCSRLHGRWCCPHGTSDRLLDIPGAVCPGFWSGKARPAAGLFLLYREPGNISLTGYYVVRTNTLCVVRVTE